MITDGLSSLYDSVRSLEQLKGRLSPESAIPEEMQSGNPPSSTFDYVWGALPETIANATIKIENFRDFIHGMVYKNNTIGDEKDCDKTANSDHVNLVGSVLDCLVETIIRLEFLPDILSGNEDSSESGKVFSHNNSLSFVDLWRDLPELLCRCSDRIRKVESRVEDTLLSVDDPRCPSPSIPDPEPCKVPCK